MANVCFFFEDYDVDVWSGRRIDFDAWNYAFQMVGDIEKIIVVNRTDKSLHTFNSQYDVEFVEELPTLSGKIAQLVTPWEVSESTSLWDFNHDVDWYVYGPAAGWCGNYFGTPVSVPQEGLGSTHSIFINTIVMADRYNKIHNK